MNIDLNSDLGESFGAWRMGDDAAMLAVVSSANVACGFHAGDPAGILATLRSAAAQAVCVGAHVSYPDLVGFGRRHMDMASADLQASVIYQIGALQGLATVAGTRVRYVKPHGALYNFIAHDARQAADVIAAVKAVDPSLGLVVLAGSALAGWARKRVCAPSKKPLLIGAIAPTVVSCPGINRAPCCTTRTPLRPACCNWPGTAPSPPWTAAWCASLRIRSVSTATAPARSPWRSG